MIRTIPLPPPSFLLLLRPSPPVHGTSFRGVKFTGNVDESLYNETTVIRNIVYEDIYDAKRAVDHLSGFNVGGRYLVVMYYQPAKFERRADAEEKKRELEELRRQVASKKAQIAARGES
jgi:hypothetical protein